MKQKKTAYAEINRLINKPKFKHLKPMSIKVLEDVSIFPYTFVKLKVGSKTTCGFSKCRPNDQWDESIGQSIALKRALS